jgi:hypothetical protein
MLLGCTSAPYHSDMINEIDMEVFLVLALFYHHLRPLFKAVPCMALCSLSI